MAGKRGRPLVVLSLSAEERDYLEQQVRRHRAPRSLSDRCRIILRCADSSKKIALTVFGMPRALGVHVQSATMRSRPL